MTNDQWKIVRNAKGPGDCSVQTLWRDVFAPQRSTKGLLMDVVSVTIDPKEGYPMKRVMMLILTVLALVLLVAADWPQFRGPNATGVSDEKNLPVEFGPERNVVWKTAVPQGNSSPVIAG